MTDGEYRLHKIKASKGLGLIERKWPASATADPRPPPIGLIRDPFLAAYDEGSSRVYTTLRITTAIIIDVLPEQLRKPRLNESQHCSLLVLHEIVQTRAAQAIDS